MTSRHPIHLRCREILHGIDVKVSITVGADACIRLANGALPDEHQLLAINQDLFTAAHDVVGALRGQVWDAIGTATLPDPAQRPEPAVPAEVGVYEYGDGAGGAITLLAVRGKYPVGSTVTAPGVDGWSPPVVAEVVFCGVLAASDGTGRTWYVLRDLRHKQPGALLCETTLRPASDFHPDGGAVGKTYVLP